MSFLSAIVQFEVPRWWRIAMIAVGTLVLCSCRTPLPNVGQVSSPAEMNGPLNSARPVTASHQFDTNIQQAHAEFPRPTTGARPALPGIGHPPVCATCPPAAAPHGLGHGFVGGHHAPFPVANAPGYGQLPPQTPEPSDLKPGDEYICDGGDQAWSTYVAEDFLVRGLDPEDTVAHYDTLDGRRLVEPTNKVCIYAPRFAAVRKVRAVKAHDQQDVIGRVHQPLAATLHEEAQLAAQYNQPLQPVGQIGTKQASTFRERDFGIALDNAQHLIDVGGRQGLLVPLGVLETGVFDQAEKAELAAAIAAAITWTHDLGVNVVVGQQSLAVDSHDKSLGQVYVSEFEGNPKIRIIKVASAKEAQPGDVIEFTLRFDNVGNELVGNVTVIDNLTTRLEYIPDSQTCSLEAGFFVERNEAESLALRWEIINPLPPGEGGVIKFKCRVR